MADEKKESQTVDATLSGTLETSHIEITPAVHPPAAPLVPVNGSVALEKLINVQLVEIRQGLEGVRLILEGDGQAGGLKTAVLLMAQKLDGAITRYDSAISSRAGWTKMWVGALIGIAASLLTYFLTRP